MLSRLGVESIRVKTTEDLSRVDRMILPGGESTTMLRFMKMYGLAPALKEFAATKPIWGICAGAILAAYSVSNPEQESLRLLNISAHRNFYGSQLDSFSTSLQVQGLEQPITAQFIRAPLLSPADGLAPAEVLAYNNNQPVFFAQKRVWASSFHVELGDDPRLHELFLKL
jgi:5'-phosphate synthase pdxT subunit